MIACDLKDAKATVETIQADGLGCAESVSLDATDRPAIDALFSHVSHEHGSVDISVSVVGGGDRRPKEPASEEQRHHWFSSSRKCGSQRQLSLSHLVVALLAK